VFRSRFHGTRPADFIDWRDYRIHGPLRRRPAVPWGYRRRHPLLRILVVLAIVWVVTRLLGRRRSSSWF
jgi:hypothetical protein